MVVCIQNAVSTTCAREAMLRMLVAASPAAGSTVQAVAAPESHTGGVLIQIEGVDLPGLGCAPSPDSPGGYFNVHVAVQRRNRRAELLGLTPGNATSATWAIDCVPVRTASGFDLKGQHIQGPPGARFIYLSWGTVDDAKNFELFRRAKLWLDCIPSEVVASAVDQGLLVGRLGLTDHKGNPLCAAVPPPLIEWSAGSGQITPGQPTVSDILG